MVLQERNEDLVGTLSADFQRRHLPLAMRGDYGGSIVLDLLVQTGTTIILVDEATFGEAHLLMYRALLMNDNGDCHNAHGMLEMGESVGLLNVGGEVLTLRVTAGGSVELQRTAGTTGYRVHISLDWLSSDQQPVSVLATYTGDQLRARNASGLGLYDDGGNLGVFIEDGGQVGINNATPAHALDVGGDVGIASNRLILAYAASTPASGPAIKWNTSGNTNVLGLYVSGGLVFQGNSSNPDLRVFTPTTDGTLGTEVIRLGGASTSADSWFNTTGEVGIGTDSPSSKLDVNGIITARPTASISTIRTNDSNARLDFITDRTVSTSAAFRFADAAGNVSVQILDSGNVGVGNAAPDGKLDVVQGSTTAAIPVLELEQLDTSEEFINFVGTIQAGGVIEADTTVPANSTHKVRVAINGSTLGYLYIYGS